MDQVYDKLEERITDYYNVGKCPLCLVFPSMSALHSHQKKKFYNNDERRKNMY
jgi:hypothetical protein